MRSFLLGLSVFLLVGGALAGKKIAIPSSFDKNYYVAWAQDHVQFLHQGKEVQISMDKASGSAIASKMVYASGFFNMRIKVPVGDSAGVVTAFYLTSHSDIHDELDFEFLGNKEGKPHYLQTNVYTNGVGNREQRFLLWFDPSARFHTYRVLWNTHQIVFFVDDTPIRVFRNKAKIGVHYPSQPMQVVGSIWDGDSWATDGGQTKVNWTVAPFKTYFRNFDIDACPSSKLPQLCYSPKFWWNRDKYSNLNSTQQKRYLYVRKNYMVYDYCSDKTRYPVPPPECDAT
ncbi:PREDICTED: xyloglucan endotransglucosylase/hydrolase protein 2-like [Nelumbo nucifera]|uniref:Xyloglucan endotransglucosylase/hydrolase n=2 Tax=Nelumbo nucifera TaxID=4432 RepID=A0A1U7YNC2_NELNU|nr:PREDICTED: xyloglucan endotransglucosylase/hydrolase protein 2-like [Nelumbo nucifera]DAD23969.1 TPA_asm: hypothetical protein HUJ06_025432 [Nelumbo nucifera]